MIDYIKYWVLFKLYCICEDYVRWIHNLEKVDSKYSDWLDKKIPENGN